MRKAMNIKLAFTALTISLISGIAAAHHSFSVFNLQQQVTIKGTVQKVQWTNPHIWVWIDVKDENGKVVTWGLEGMSPNFLARRGWSRTTLKAGDQVTVKLNPLKSGEPGGMFQSTTTPDGVVLSMGDGREEE